MMDFKWIRSNMDLYHIGENCTHIIAISNSGNLAADFYKYGCSFYDAAEQVIHYLCNEAAEKHDIAKLDLWYFATVYLYRQSLELLLKANIFQTVMNNSDRKKLVGKIRHNLRQSFEKLIEIRSLPIDKSENAKWLMSYLSDISRLDEESDMFRYPFGSKFKTLFKKQTNVRFPSTRPKRRDWKRFLSGFPMRSVRGITCGKSGKRWFLSSLNRRGRIRRKQFFGGWGYLCRMASRSFCSSPSMCGGCRFNPGKILPNT